MSEKVQRFIRRFEGARGGSGVFLGARGSSGVFLEVVRGSWVFKRVLCRGFRFIFSPLDVTSRLFKLHQNT